ncbi:hypothetical protein JTB14_027122 [Gonioctena quinquepunctata]|nr:hypothetical protein JTB14_027122 [Gonioctena quinquepunctata]
MANADLPIHTDIPYLAGQYYRLKSRHPAIRSALESNENFHATNKWITIGAETAGDHYIQLDDPTQCFNGSDLPRRPWSKLNRVRTGCGKCADSLHKWGRAESPQCDCGSPRQTKHTSYQNVLTVPTIMTLKILWKPRRRQLNGYAICM